MSIKACVLKITDNSFYTHKNENMKECDPTDT